jgi:hypothetical protein
MPVEKHGRPPGEETPMKPDKKTHPKAYKAWVRKQCATWDPSDDRGGPTVYVPRFNGIRASDVEELAQAEKGPHARKDA